LIVNNNNNTNVNNVTIIQQTQQVAQQVLLSSNTVANTNTPPPTAIITPSNPAPVQIASTDNFQVVDETQQIGFNTPGQPYTGTIGGVTNQYVEINADRLDIKALTPNAFIHSGSGNDIITAFAGRNVLDAGSGSNVMAGGIGQNTFIASVVGEQPGSNVVDQIKNFHAGDDAIIRGLSPSDFTLQFSDATGAFGPELLLQATSKSGGPNATIGLAGFSTGDLASGRLSLSFSNEPSGTSFLLIHVNS